jgi:AraC-like DNA-binding protein
MTTDRAYVEWQVRTTALADRLVCAWRDTTGVDESHVVLPDACIDLVWDGARVIVAGPDTRAWSSRGGATFVGVRFRPGAAPGFLGVPASAMLNESLPLADLWGETAALALAEQLAAAGDAAPHAFEAALLERISQAPPPDPVVSGLLRTFKHGAPAVNDVAEELGLSARSLHRRATEALGYGPKMLERILRFRRALQLVQRRVALADAALLSGYTDQSHMTNEFRALAGATPRQMSHGGRLVLSANGL